MSLEVLLVPGGLGGEGGLAVDVRNLANGLARVGQRVGLVTVGSAGHAEPDVTTVPVRTLPLGRPAGVFGLHIGIKRILCEHPKALVHAFGCMPSYLTFAAIAAARRRGRHVVWTPMFHPLRRRVWEQRLVLQPMKAFDALAPRAASLTDVVAAATEAEAELFARAGARRVELLPPVVERVEPASMEAAGAVRARYGLVGAPLIVSIVSRDEPRKGLPFAFETFRRLRLAHPSSRLLVVGLDAASPNPPAGVVLGGRLSDSDLAAALRAADVVFVPSLFEAFSRVVIEAWQQETPVVVSDGVALAPTVDRVGGLVVPFGDAAAAAEALARVLLEPAEAQAFGRQGATIVEQRFLLEHLVSRTAAIYDELHAT